MGALDGIKVFDLSVLIQGPQAAAMLADLGAEVIKIELLDVGDLARWIAVSPEDDRSAMFWACNRGKRQADKNSKSIFSTLPGAPQITP